MTGNSGSDQIDGKDGDDTLLGTGAETRGAGQRDPRPGRDNSFGELDTLTGGAGGDRFILGDSSGAYYKTYGKEDFVTITDFGSGDVIQLGATDTYSTTRTETGFDLFVTTDGANELIASVQRATTTGIDNNANIAGDPLANLPEGNFTLAAGEYLGDIFIGV